MQKFTGTVAPGIGHFGIRMRKHPHVFEAATGQILHPGSLNVNLDKRVPVKEHFRIAGATINETDQDLVFEICRLNGKWVYRVRPWNLKDRSGGHGDNVIEVVSGERLRDPKDKGGLNLKDGDTVEIEFFG